MASASGFQCPKCGNDKLADVVSKDLVHIIELKCRQCGTQWAVEQAHPPGALGGGFMDERGRVERP
jgi:transcription elongation factor Elf1